MFSLSLAISTLAYFRLNFLSGIYFHLHVCWANIYLEGRRIFALSDRHEYESWLQADSWRIRCNFLTLGSFIESSFSHRVTNVNLFFVSSTDASRFIFLGKLSHSFFNFRLSQHNSSSLSHFRRPSSRMHIWHNPLSFSSKCIHVELSD